MCGIAGFIRDGGFSPEAGRDTLQRMVRVLAHRGPDDSGCWMDPAAGIALGHRRLAVVDLSPHGHQPMHSACGRYVVAFNGEIYNFLHLRDQLATRGHRFRGHSDTEVLLAAIVEWGIRGALERFNGMFAFGLWDCGERVLHLARDRAGEKPLYYGHVAGGIAFASELKAFRAHPDFVGEIDRNAVAMYLRHSAVPAPYSIYTGIRKLPQGTLLSLRHPYPSLPDPQPYWTAASVAEAGTSSPLSGSVAEATDELDRLVRDAVRLRMVADVPLGAFLSGGIDSSLVVAAMQAQSGTSVQTFTIGFGEGTYNEAEHAKRVAKHLGTEHTELYVTPTDALAVIPRLPAIYDEPFADSSQIPTFLVSELARRHVTVSLSGDGGDELFGGYPRHFWGLVRARMEWMPNGLRRVFARVLARTPDAAWDGIFRGLRPIVPKRFGAKSLSHRARQMTELLALPDPDTLYSALATHGWNGTGWNNVVLGVDDVPPLSAAHTWRGSPSAYAERMLYLDLVTYLADDILAKVDRASMAVSLEVRVPLLDPRLIEFAWRVPLALKLRGGRGKWLLRQVLYRYVPPELVERPKMGFCVPIDTWLRGPLRDWAETLLDEGELRRHGLLDPRPVRAMWRQHLEGKRDRHLELWDVLMLQAWLREAEIQPAYSENRSDIVRLVTHATAN